jgi:hypothetical protein
MDDIVIAANRLDAIRENIFAAAQDEILNSDAFDWHRSRLGLDAHLLR